MGWLHRIARDSPVALAAGELPAVVEEAERTTPGGKALFDGLRADRSRAVLDLGPAGGASLGVYGRFARWVRFADVLSRAVPAQQWTALLPMIPANPERPYDLLILWDVLDRLPPEARAPLVARIAEVSAPDARLFAVVRSGQLQPAGLLRYSFAEVDCMRYAETGEPASPEPPALPAEVGRVLAPFQVTHAFSTRLGIREYVAVRRE